MAAAAQDRPRWLVGPALDLVVGCGAWSLPLVGLLYAFGGGREAGVTLAFYALSLLCNYPHYMATIYRAYRTRSEFDAYKRYTLHVTLLLLLTAAFVHWSLAWAPIFFTVYLTWSPWHYMGQNFGVAMLFARRDGWSPTRGERRALWWAFVASFAMIFLTIHTGVSEEQFVRPLGLPASFAVPAGYVCAAVFVLGAAFALRRAIRAAGFRAMLPVVVVVTTQFVWFVLPSVVVTVSGTEFRRTSYSAGVLAFMHCAQYLWITGYYARRGAEERGERWRPWVYALSLVAGGVALFLPGPWLVSYVFRYDFTASFLIFGALVNIHHFVVDGRIWKLRDARVSSVLIASAGVDEPHAAAARPWTDGWRPLGRALRAGLVVALLALAVVDLARFALANGRSDRSSLETAARLNPFDASVRAAIARTQAAAGDADGAIATLRQAVAVDPYSAASQRALTRILVENGRYEEAYRQYAEMIRYVPADADTLVNYGSLAAQFGHDDEAVDAFRRALELDDSLPLPHLRLAESLARAGRYDAAIGHFESYVALAGDRMDDLGGPKQLASVLLETGDAYAATNRPAQAEVYYRHAAEFASAAGDASLEGGALGRIAAVLDGTNRSGEAGPVYVLAIERDTAAGDAEAAGIEWFNYGQWLRERGAPPRLVLACLAKAKAAAPGRPEIDRAIADVGGTPPADLDAALDEAKRYAGAR